MSENLGKYDLPNCPRCIKEWGTRNAPAPPDHSALQYNKMVPLSDAIHYIHGEMLQVSGRDMYAVLPFSAWRCVYCGYTVSLRDDKIRPYLEEALASR